MALSIQSTFAKAGIKLEIIPGDGKQTLTKYRARRHDHLYRRLGAGLYGSAHQCRRLCPESGQRRRFTIQTPCLEKCLGYSGDDPKKSMLPYWNGIRPNAPRMYMDLQRQHQQISPFVIMFQDIEVVAERANVNNFILGPSFDSNFYRYTTK